MTKEKYDERKEAKIEYAKKRAGELRSSCDRVFKRGFGEDVTGIPFGQPILVGHHSERRHRNAIKKMDNKINKALDDGNKSDYYLAKAKRMEENTVISSDDPSAVKLLKEKLIKLEKLNLRSKDLNAKLRKFKTLDNAKIEINKLPNDNKDKNILLKLINNHFYALPPQRISAYYIQTSNNTVKIKNVKDRIKRLEKESLREYKEYELNEVKVIENTEENRIQLFFEAIPEESMRTKLKGSGFKWSRFGGCWQRMLNNNSIWATKRVLEQLKEEVTP
jgi:hypothetical protein